MADDEARSIVQRSSQRAARDCHENALDGRGVLLFVVVAFAWSWAWWLPFVVAGDEVRQGEGWPSQHPGLLGPLVAALVVITIRGGRAALRAYFARLVRWRIGWRTLLRAIAPLAAFFVVAVIADWGIAWRDLDDISGLPEMGVPALWLVLVTVNGLGEEGGWRGYLYPTLRQRWAFAPAALLVTVVWAAWHLPLFVLLESYGDFSAFTLVGFVIGLGAGAVVLGWVYETTGSVLAAAVWHATYNLVAATGDSTVRSSVVTALVIAWAVGLLLSSETYAGRTATSD